MSINRVGLGRTQVQVWEATARLCGGDPSVPVSIYAIARETGLHFAAVKASIRRMQYRAKHHPAEFSWPFATHGRGRPPGSRRDREARPEPAPAEAGPVPVWSSGRPPDPSPAVVAGQELARWRDLMKRWYGPAWRRRLREASLRPRGRMPSMGQEVSP